MDIIIKGLIILMMIAGTIGILESIDARDISGHNKRVEWCEIACGDVGVHTVDHSYLSKCFCNDGTVTEAP